MEDYNTNIYLVTAPSGAGKTTIVKAISQMGVWTECISHTSREMRDGEVEGFDYFFVSDEEFERMEENGEFAETITYANEKRYGVSKKEIEAVMNMNEDVVIIVNYDGYKQVKEIYPEAIGIFIVASAEQCIMNMAHRGDSKASIVTRTMAYNEEIENMKHYDYKVKNEIGRLSTTLNEVIGIVHKNSK